MQLNTMSWVPSVPRILQEPPNNTGAACRQPDLAADDVRVQSSRGEITGVDSRPPARPPGLQRVVPR